MRGADGEAARRDHPVHAQRYRSVMDETKLLPFQREGVQQGVALNGRLLIGDEMGLGKTVQAIALACRYHHEWPLLIFAPTSMCLPWCEELERWCPFLRPGDINLVRSHHNGALRLAPITICSYGLMTNGKEKERLAGALKTANFGVIIADEAHYLKSKDAQRSQLVLPLLAGSRRTILLTGTPALNRPVELYTLLHALCPRVSQFATYKAFTERFCGAHLRVFGRTRHLDVSGCTNAPELHELLRRHAMVRRLKSDVLAQLPPKRRQRILLTLTGGAGRGASSAATAELAQLDKAMSAASKDDERGKQFLLSQMCVALGSAKAHAAAEIVLEMLPSCRDGRLLFFAHHQTMLDAVGAAAASANIRTFRIDGSVAGFERQGLVNAFQALPAGTPAIFLLSILAAGQGLTLTGASTAVFGELRWTPGELLQAEDRCHRIGQRSAVNVYYLVAKVPTCPSSSRHALSATPAEPKALTLHPRSHRTRRTRRCGQCCSGRCGSSVRPSTVRRGGCRLRGTRSDSPRRRTLLATIAHRAPLLAMTPAPMVTARAEAKRLCLCLPARLSANGR